MATFAHNAFGQRARKTETTSSTSTVFAYAPGGQILTERRLRSNGTRELEREYLWLDSLPIAMAERSYAADGTTVTTSQFVYLHADHLDTPRLATDAAQRVVWRWRSDGFGIGTAETNPDGDSIATEVPLRFPGQYLDAETGLHYNYYRDGYDPTVGRYTQADPIGLVDSFSLYVYVGGDPISGRDPSGLITYSDVASAYAHYCRGSGTPWSVAFTSLNWAVDPVGLGKDYVEAFARALGGLCRDAMFPVTYQTGIDTSGADALLVGRHSIKLTGTLKLGCDCSWSFHGSVGSALGYEYYNFNRSNRSLIKEALTTAGRYAYKSGKAFRINITGSASVTASGTTGGTPTCCKR